MLTLAIQAGGQSRRMGSDKGLLPFRGKPLVQRVLERLAPLADEVLVTTNQPEAYGFLQARLVPDARPNLGALGGLYTALLAASHPLVAVVACDMPFASRPLLALARDRLLETGADAVIPRKADGLEPFHAVYRRETCLPAVEAALDAGRLRVDSWFHEVQIVYLEAEELRLHDPAQLSFWNANTPDELRQAEQIAAQNEP